MIIGGAFIDNYAINAPDKDRNNFQPGHRPHSAWVRSHACKYGGQSFPDYSELQLCNFPQRDIETPSAAAPSSFGVLGDESVAPRSSQAASSAQGAARALRWAADFEAPSTHTH
eukprot:5918101-Pyramimonas_sp.AAC.1